jgi:hypothetical protein
MRSLRRTLCQLIFVAALVFLAALAHVSAANSNTCQSLIQEKIQAAASQYKPDPSTQGTHASLSIDPNYSDGFVHHFDSGRQPDAEAIPLISDKPLPVTSDDLTAVVSGSLRRLDKAKTISPHAFTGALIIFPDGEHVQLLACVDPAAADPGEYRGSIAVFATRDVDAVAVPIDISLRPTQPGGFLLIGILVIVVGIVIKVVSDLEKLSADPNGRLPFGATLRQYWKDWVRPLSLVFSAGAGGWVLYMYFSTTPALIGGFDDFKAMATAVLAAELSVGSVTDLLGFFVHPSGQSTTTVAPGTTPAAGS